MSYAGRSCFAPEPIDKDIDKTPGAGLPVWVGLVIGKANLRSQKVDGLSIVPDRSVGDGALHKSWKVTQAQMIGSS